MIRKLARTPFPILAGSLVLGLTGSPAFGADIVDRLQVYYRSIKGYSAAFTEEMTPPGAKAPVVHTGRVDILIPSRMKWDYSEADKSDIVIDGERVWLVYAKRNEAMFWKIEEDRGAPIAYQFLLGAGDLKKSFNIPSQKKVGEGWEVQLSPKDSLYGIGALTLVVKDSPPRIEGLDLTGAMGEQVRLRFRNFEEKDGFPPGTFEYAPGPKTRVRDAQDLLSAPK